MEKMAVPTRIGQVPRQLSIRNISRKGPRPPSLSYRCSRSGNLVIAATIVVTLSAFLYYNQANQIFSLVESDTPEEDVINNLRTGGTLASNFSTDLGQVEDPYFQRLCTKDALEVSESDVPKTAPVAYQCEGQAYDSFIEEMNAYAENMRSKKEQWGLREFPIPSNRVVLMIGNSHTRQVARTLWCQYADLVSKSFHEGDADELHFMNNSTLHIIANTPYVYSEIWPTLFERHMNISMASVDAVILGDFNNFSKTNSTFQMQMKNFSQTMSDIDYEHIKAPGPADVQKHFEGPIVAVSMFSEYALKRFENKVAKVKDRHNFSFISGRYHVAKLGECGSDGREEVGTCLMQGDQSKYGRNPQDMHRCTGRRGGHPDLISWDIIETLWKVLE